VVILFRLSIVPRKVPSTRSGRIVYVAFAGTLG